MSDHTKYQQYCDSATSSQSFASSTVANIIDGNGQRNELLPPSEAVQISAHNSIILFQNWQIPALLWIEPSDGGAVFIDNRWYRGLLQLITLFIEAIRNLRRSPH
ncbi:hypothetical protein [Chlorogloea sp. CCALA 695]|uniref:hypothetical protein n=1 Tax=Chlorogloea sp. CCALA 695 TaxID=2107693 RepID=UPI000D04FF73|nr:hypothetical protein [Chlorogloea sp. CCALA 695]PSB25949.1 hypothetical protein C7B70_24475 [Chlorogloea sp. CCALA 695]